MTLNDLNSDNRGTSTEIAAAVFMVLIVSSAAVVQAGLVGQIQHKSEQTTIEEANIEVLTQDKVRVTPTIGDELSADDVEVRITFPEKNTSGVAVRNINDAAQKSQATKKNVTEQITVGVKEVPVYENVSIPGVGVRKRISHYERKVVTKTVTHNETFYNFTVDGWHNKTAKEPASCRGKDSDDHPVHGNGTTGRQGPPDEDCGLKLGKKKGVGVIGDVPFAGDDEEPGRASSIVSGVGGSFTDNKQSIWANGESFIVDLKDDVISEGDVVRVQVIDTNSNSRVLDEQERANNLRYAGFDLGGGGGDGNETDNESDPSENAKPTGTIHGPDMVEQGQEVTFNLEAHDADGTVTKRSWSNGQIGSTADYEFEAEPGANVTISATVEDNDGATRTVTKTVKVTEPDNNAPSVSISGPSDVEQGESVRFTAEASDDGQITRIQWGNGDSGNSTLRVFYSDPGTTETVEVTVTDDDGAKTTETKVVRVTGGNDDDPVNREPDVSISGPDNVQSGESATFTAHANDPDGYVSSIEWENGQSGKSATWTFNQPPGSTATVKVTVTDDDGGTTTATKTVQVTEPPLSVNIHGPDQVKKGSTATFSASVHPSDESIVKSSWSMGVKSPGSDSGALEKQFYFEGEPGETRAVRVTVRDDDGSTATDTKEVEIVDDGPDAPEVFVDVVNQGGSAPNANCLPVGENASSSTLKASATDPDPGGEVVKYRWFDTTHTNTIGYNDELTYKPSGSPGDTVTLAVKVWDNTGKTETKSKTYTLCKAKAETNTPPSLKGMAAYDQHNSDFGQGHTGEENAFGRVVSYDTSNEGHMYFQADASDPDGDNGDLTYIWKFPSGQMKTHGEKSSVQYMFRFPPDDYPNTTIWKDVTLIVKDGDGAEKRYTKSIGFDPNDLMDKDQGKESQFDISVSGTSVEVGDEVTVSVTVNKDASEQSFTLTYGDGTTVYSENDGSIIPSTETYEFTHSYEKGGTYTVQVIPPYDARPYETGDQITIHVGGQEFTEYHYNVEVEEAHTVAREKPGPLWKESGIDHFKYEVLNREEATVEATKDLLVDTYRDRGYTVSGSHYEKVQTGTLSRTTHDRPGSAWTLEEENVGTVTVADGWEHVVVDEKGAVDAGRMRGGEGGERNYHYVGRVKNTYTTKKYTTSVNKPGGQWSREGWTGDLVQKGYNYMWRDSQLPPGYGDHDLVDTRRTKVQDAKYEWKRIKTQDAEWDWVKVQSARYERRCTNYEYRWDWGTPTRTCTSYSRVKVQSAEWDYRKVQDAKYKNVRVKVQDAKYDTDYKYRYPDKKKVYRWSKTVQRTDYDYKYRYRTYKDVSAHKWTKPTYEQRKFYDLEKVDKRTITYYEWTKGGTTKRVSLTKPDPGNIVGEITEKTFKCSSGKGELREEACS